MFSKAFPAGYIEILSFPAAASIFNIVRSKQHLVWWGSWGWGIQLWNRHFQMTTKTKPNLLIKHYIMRWESQPTDLSGRSEAFKGFSSITSSIVYKPKLSAARLYKVTGQNVSAPETLVKLNETWSPSELYKNC